MSEARTILHVDMDAFFASVEQRDRPELRGKPVLVGGAGRRGVVAAASYEARVFGCRSAMPTGRALRLCPTAIVVRPRFDRYRTLSEQVFAILGRFTDLLEPLSIDEAFLDVTGSRRLHGDGAAIAAAIRRSIRDESGLTASVGVAPNKFLAKLASAIRKPDGMTVVDEAFLRDALPTLPVRRMWGVGPALEARLVAEGVRTFGDLASAAPERLAMIVGGDPAQSLRLARLARGADDRPVEADRTAKSIGHERTFHEDLDDAQAIRAEIVEAIASTARRLRRAELSARCVTIKLRSPDFRTITRSTTLEKPTDRTDLLRAAALSLLERWLEAGPSPLRLVGAALSELVAAPPEPSLFEAEADDRRRAFDAVSDRIATRFGGSGLRPRRST
ncbi:MAG TPA: DNA polymerase IV [Phycisphaerales bacterium]|nr:DNA polymerase IV [Phycisphaerales bacterium]HMP38491.1 DNA polymerase IV [Phycisphaerales bacterium]